MKKFKYLNLTNQAIIDETFTQRGDNNEIETKNKTPEIKMCLFFYDALGLVIQRLKKSYPTITKDLNVLNIIMLKDSPYIFSKIKEIVKSMNEGKKLDKLFKEKIVIDGRTKYLNLKNNFSLDLSTEMLRLIEPLFLKNSLPLNSDGKTELINIARMFYEKLTIEINRAISMLNNNSYNKYTFIS